MNAILTFLVALVMLILQSTLVQAVLPPYLLPDPILLLVLFLSVWFPTGRGLLTSFSLGLLADLMSGAPEGWNTFFAVMIFAMNRWIQGRVVLGRSQSTLSLFLLDFGLKLPYIFITRADSVMSFTRDILPVWLGEALASLLLMPVLFGVLSRSLVLQHAKYVDHRQIR